MATALPRVPRLRLGRPMAPDPALFVAEFVVWLGFGAFLPVLPLYLSRGGSTLRHSG